MSAPPPSSSNQKHPSIPLPTPTSNAPSKILYTPPPTPAANPPLLKPPQQPHTTPIAHFVSTPNLPHCGSLLDVNSSYIVYAVKNGLVRVIDRNSASRTLLRGHNVRIADVSFFGSASASFGGETTKGGSSDVLGTVGGAGDVSGILIWRVFNSNDNNNNNQDELLSEKLLEIRYSKARRLIWHPFNPNMFILLSTSCEKSLAMLVETTKLYTSRHESEMHAVCTSKKVEEGGGGGGKEEIIENALQFIVEKGEEGGGVMTDLTWSNLDARHVLSSHSDGVIKLWDLRDWTFFNSNYEKVLAPTTASMIGEGEKKEDTIASAKCLISFQGATDEEAIDRVIFLPPSGGEKGANTLTSKFVSSSRNNTKLVLWSEFTLSVSGVVKPTKLQEFEFSPSAAGASMPPPGIAKNDDLNLKLSLCCWNENGAATATPAPPPGMMIPSSTPTTTSEMKTFLILADQSQGNLYTIHLNSSSNPTFEYITPFKIVYPVYSFISSSAKTEEEEGWEMNVFCVQSKAVQLLRIPSKMISKPPSLWSEDQWGGVVNIEEVKEQQNVVTEDEVEYDDYDHEEDEEMMMHTRTNDESSDEDEGGAPPSSTLPPPFFNPPPDSANEAAPAIGGGAGFTNWLGSLAASNSTAPAPPPPPPPPPGVGLLTTQPPQNTPHPITTKQITTPAAAPPPGIPLPTPATPTPPPPPPPGVIMPSPSTSTTSSQNQTFLNPMDFGVPQPPPGLSNAPPPPLASTSAAELKSTAKGNKKSRRSNTPSKKNQQSQPSSAKKREKSPKRGGKNSKNSEDEKKVVAILKRQDGPTIPTSTSTATEQQQQQQLDRAISAPPKTLRTTPEDANLTITRADLEATLLKSQPPSTSREEMKSLLQEELKVTTSKITKSLSNSMEQIVELKVVKPLNVSISKSGKESSKVRTNEVVEEVRGCIREPLMEAFTETMKEVMIPAYEAATKQMFTQISSSISSGFDSYILQEQQQQSLKQRQYEEQIQKTTQKQMEVMDSLVNKMNQMNIVMESLSKEVMELRGIVARSSAGAGVAGMGGIQGAQQQQQPPQPPIDQTQLIREEVMSYLRAGQYEQAFTKALSVSNGEMAVFACKNADLSIAFGSGGGAAAAAGGGKLSQPILLCLMQQLGAVLLTSYDKDDLRIELAWLQEIAVSVDTNHESIRRHVGQVLQQLVANINAKMAEGDVALRRPLQTLLQVIRGMGGGY